MGSFVRGITPHIDSFLKHYRDRGATSDAASFSSQIKYFLRFMSSQRKYISHVSEIHRKDIELFVKYLWNVEYGAHFNKETFLNRNNFVYRALRALNKFFEYLAIYEDDIEDRHLPKPDLIRKADFPSPHRRGARHFPRWFEKLLLQEIRALPEGKLYQLKFKTFMFTLFYLGARIKDACTIERGSFLTKHKTSWIRIFSNKTKFWYEVPMHIELKKYIEKYIKESTDLIGQHPTTNKNGINFLFWDSTKSTIENFTRGRAGAVMRFCEKVLDMAVEKGLPVKDMHTLFLTSHKFRHTVGIRLIRMGADPMLVAEFLGHSDLAMAQSYIQESQEEIDELMDELWDDDSLGLSEDVAGGLDATLDEIFACSGVVTKVENGWCVHVNEKTPCGDDAYECWTCPILKPDYADPDYLDRLRKELSDHQALLERNIRLGYLGAAKAEELVVEKIQQFIDEVKAEKVSKNG